jgi:serine/threonine protein phosphatase PrpC
MIPAKEFHFRVASQTHEGESGKNNEDAFYLAPYRLEERGEPSIVAIVADGVGGHRAGEIASRMAVDTVSKRIGEASGEDPVSQLRSAIIEAGRTISTAAEAFPERQGMASTIAVAWIIGARLYTAYAGDSRIYLLRRGRIQQTTVDHSWVQEAIEHNIISEDEARDHPNAHILRKYLGGNLEPQPDFRLRLTAHDSDRKAVSQQGVTLAPGDQVLLCTDGLTDLVSDKEIRDALANGSPEEAASALVILARARGGHDNITVVLVAVPGGRPIVTRRRKARTVLLVVIGVLVALALVALAAGWWFGFWS